MSDNFNITEGIGKTIAADEAGIDNILFQKIKLFDSTDGSTTAIGIASNPLRTDPTGTTIQPVSISGTPSISGSVSVINFPSTYPVTGTFWQITQPVSIASMPSTPVTGTFWQATQPVSIASMPSTPVTGTFWPSIQPTSQSGTWTIGRTWNLLNTSDSVNVGNFPATQPISGSISVSNFPATQPISGSVSIANFPATQPVSIASTLNTAEDYLTGKVAVMKTGTLVTTAVTADQVILTYTVTTGKTFYLLYYNYDTRATVVSATASILGTISLETPSGTKTITSTEVNPTTSETSLSCVTLPVPIPIPSGTVIRVVCTPASTTSTTWVANFGGYEK